MLIFDIIKNGIELTKIKYSKYESSYKYETSLEHTFKHLHKKDLHYLVAKLDNDRYLIWKEQEENEKKKLTETNENEIRRRAALTEEERETEDFLSEFGLI